MTEMLQNGYGKIAAKFLRIPEITINFAPI